MNLRKDYPELSGDDVIGVIKDMLEEGTITISELKFHIFRSIDIRSEEHKGYLERKFGIQNLDNW